MGSYSELPIGLALLPCDTIIEDRRTGKKSVIGIVGIIKSTKFPFEHSGMQLLVSLTGGHGGYPCRLELIREDTGAAVFSAPGKLRFSNPKQVVDVIFVLPKLTFSEPGVYLLKFWIDDVPLMMRPLQVIPFEPVSRAAEPPPPTP